MIHMYLHLPRDFNARAALNLGPFWITKFETDRYKNELVSDEHQKPTRSTEPMEPTSAKPIPTLQSNVDTQHAQATMITKPETDLMQDHKARNRQMQK